MNYEKQEDCVIESNTGQVSGSRARDRACNRWCIVWAFRLVFDATHIPINTHKRMRLIKHNHHLTQPLLRSLALLAMLWGLSGIPTAAFAQMVPSSAEAPAATEIPENLTREQVRDLVARLSDDQVRELIITQLDKQAVEQEQGGDPMVYVGQLREGLQVAWVAFARMFTAGDKVHALPGSIWRQITDNGRVSGW